MILLQYVPSEIPREYVLALSKYSRETDHRVTKTHVLFKKWNLTWITRTVLDRPRTMDIADRTVYRYVPAGTVEVNATQ
jgi:hypothetical protein